MKACDACGCDTERTSKKGGCICADVDAFFQEPGVSELMTALSVHDQATPEEREAWAKEQPGASRCNFCFFFNCRCAAGIKGRMETI